MSGSDRVHCIIKISLEILVVKYLSSPVTRLTLPYDLCSQVRDEYVHELSLLRAATDNKKRTLSELREKASKDGSTVSIDHFVLCSIVMALL